MTEIIRKESKFQNNSFALGLDSEMLKFFQIYPRRSFNSFGSDCVDLVSALFRDVYDA